MQPLSIGGLSESLSQNQADNLIWTTSQSQSSMHSAPCQIERDKSSFKELGLFADDNLENVRQISLSGEPGAEDLTHIEIFGHISGRK